MIKKGRKYQCSMKQGKIIFRNILRGHNGKVGMLEHPMLEF